MDSGDIGSQVESMDMQAQLSQNYLTNRLARSTGYPSRVLVTVPVYNEASLLEKSISSLRNALDASGIDYVLSVFEDGSTDGTKEVLSRIQASNHSIFVKSFPEKHGRGWALRTQWPSLSYDVFVFCDADLAAGPEALLSAIRKVGEGFDLVIGSRYVEGAKVRRPPARKFASLAYNLILRMVFSDGIDDHQCGLKAFSRQGVDRIVNASKEDSWFWDTEVILIARKLKMPVGVIPVDWTERKSRRTHILRLLSDVYIHGSGILRLKGNLSGRFQQGGMFVAHTDKATPTGTRMTNEH